MRSAAVAVYLLFASASATSIMRAEVEVDDTGGASHLRMEDDDDDDDDDDDVDDFDSSGGNPAFVGGNKNTRNQASCRTECHEWWKGDNTNNGNKRAAGVPCIYIKQDGKCWGGTCNARGWCHVTTKENIDNSTCMARGIPGTNTCSFGSTPPGPPPPGPPAGGHAVAQNPAFIGGNKNTRNQASCRKECHEWWKGGNNKRDAGVSCMYIKKDGKCWSGTCNAHGWCHVTTKENIDKSTCMARGIPGKNTCRFG